MVAPLPIWHDSKLMGGSVVRQSGPNFEVKSQIAVQPELLWPGHGARRPGSDETHAPGANRRFAQCHHGLRIVEVQWRSSYARTARMRLTTCRYVIENVSEAAAALPRRVITPDARPREEQHVP